MVDQEEELAEAILMRLPKKILLVLGKMERMQESLWPEEEIAVSGAVLQRRAEFRASRTCARLALRKLGQAAGAILKGRYGEPIWPEGIVGSITHAEGYCAVIVTSRQLWTSVGLDIESSSALEPELADLVCSSIEKSFYCMSEERQVDWAKLTFVIKEAAFKALFPLTRQYLDFLDVEISINWTDGTFEASIEESQLNSKSAIRRLSGFWGLSGGILFSVALVPSS